jgi:hypothetical protein
MSILSKVTSSQHLFYAIRRSKTLSLTKYLLISLKQERYERLFSCDLINHQNTRNTDSQRIAPYCSAIVAAETSNETL